jgi:alkylation response protein AidB-like acyl-CoA dehydrogenase
MALPKDFGFGVEEQLLQKEARSFFKKNLDELKLMELVAQNPDPHRDPECLWDEKMWEQMVDLGWTTMAIPEDLGGTGMSSVAVASLIEETGRVALPSPLMAAVNSAYVLRACGTESANAVLKEMAEDKTASLAITNRKGSWSSLDTDVSATVDGDTTTLSGMAWFVQDARKVDLFIVKAQTESGIGLYTVAADAPGVTIVPDAIVDLTRDQARVKFDGVAVASDRVVAAPGKGNLALDAAEPAILTMVSADMCGAAEWQLQTTTQYAKTRVQFDRPIGFFQAVKHPIVNMMIMIDSARSHTYNAACALDHGPEQAGVDARMAKAAASDMAAFCSGRSVQYHGGMGFTWECFVHLFFKRQIHNQVLYGDAAYHRAILADEMIGPVSA